MAQIQPWADALFILQDSLSGTPFARLACSVVRGLGALPTRVRIVRSTGEWRFVAMCGIKVNDELHASRDLGLKSSMSIDRQSAY